MSNTEQISLKHLSHAIPNPNPECLFCIRIAVGKHSSLVLIAHCIGFVIFFLKEWITAGSAEVILDFIKAVHTVFYTLFTLIRGERDPAYSLECVRQAFL